MHRSHRVLLVLLLVLPGALAAGVFGYVALQDWAQLRIAYARFGATAAGGDDLRTLFAAYAVQDIHRVNLFADGVWSLLGAILAGIGVHGLCTGSGGPAGQAAKDASEAARER